LAIIQSAVLWVFLQFSILLAGGCAIIHF